MQLQRRQLAELLITLLDPQLAPEPFLQSDKKQYPNSLPLSVPPSLENVLEICRRSQQRM